MAKKNKKEKKETEYGLPVVGHDEVVDLDSIKINLLLIVKNKSQFNSVVQFLNRRGWGCTVSTGMNEAIAFLAKEKPQFVMISFNHPNPKLTRLPTLLSQTFNTNCIGFCETPDLRTESRLTASKMQYKLVGAASGPSIHRRIIQILAEMYGQADDEEKIKNNVGFNTGKSNSSENKTSYSQGGQSEDHSDIVQVKGGSGDQYLDGKSNKENRSKGSFFKMFSSEKKEHKGPAYMKLGKGESMMPEMSAAELLKKLQGALGDENEDLDSFGSEENLTNRVAKRIEDDGFDYNDEEDAGDSAFDFEDQDDSDARDLVRDDEEEDFILEEKLRAQERKSSTIQKGEGTESIGAIVQKGLESKEGGSVINKGEKKRPQLVIQQGVKSKVKFSLFGADNTSTERMSEQEARDIGGRLGIVSSENQVGELGIIVPGKSKLGEVDVQENDSQESDKFMEDLLSKDYKVLNAHNFFTDEKSYLFRAVTLALENTKPSQSKPNYDFHKAKKLGVMPLISKDFNGYLTFVSDVRGQFSTHFMDSFRKELQKILSMGKIEISIQEGLIIEVIDVDTKMWNQDCSKFFINREFGQGEILISFMETEQEIPIIAAENNDSMTKVDPKLLFPEKELNFNAYIFMDKSDRFLLYTKDGRYLSSKQQLRLLDKNRDIYIAPKDIKAFQQYFASNVLNDLIDYFLSQKSKKSS